MTARDRITAVDRILDAASRRRRRDMPGRYRYAGRVVTALVGIGEGLTAVAEAVGEADEHARHRFNSAKGWQAGDEELRAMLEQAWTLGHSVGDRAAASLGEVDEARAEAVDRVLGSRHGVTQPPAGWL